MTGSGLRINTSAAIHFSGNTDLHTPRWHQHLRQFGFALLRGQLVKGLGLLLAQEGLVVILVTLAVLVGVIAQIAAVMDALLLGGHGEGNDGQDAKGRYRPQRRHDFTD